jgi:hypothetical protein
MNEDQAEGNKRLDEEMERSRAEVRRRESRLASISEQIAQLRFQLDQSSVGKSLLSGNAALIRNSEAYRSALGEKLKRRLADRETAQQELNAAIEKRASLEEELKE